MVPREGNVIADRLSRIVDHDDWQLSHDCFVVLDELLGPHTVDRFASHYNAQLKRFNSRYSCPDTEAVDAFTVVWSGENNWWCPQQVLVPKILRHAMACKCVGTLVIPCWESAPYWPLLCPVGSAFAPFVVDYRALPMEAGIFVPGSSGSVLFKDDIPNTAVFALRIVL